MFRAFSRKNLERIKHVWGAGRIWGGSHVQHRLQHPLVQERINIKVSGTAQMNRFEYFLERYLRGKMPVERALTLGSGVGELERGLCQYGFARFHEGLDLSDEAVQIATQTAQSAGFDHIRYRTADLNTVVLAGASYDMIFGVSSIRHVENLEHLFSQVQRAIKPGGYFFLDEFVGPSRFQWTDVQIQIMNDQLQQLPKHLCRLISDRAKFKERVIRKSLPYMAAADPSEAVRSSEIVPLLAEYFRILEIKGYGGAILHELLYDIAGNFCEENPGSLDCLRKLFEVEDQLTACQTVGDDFAVIIATRGKTA